MKSLLREKRLRKWWGGNQLFVKRLVAEQPLTLNSETSDDAEVKQRDTHFFIEQKLSSLHTAGNVCMTWWVSSLVFSGTILAAVWLERKQIRNSPFMMVLLLFVVAAFFAGIVFFGYQVINYLMEFKKDVSKIARTSPRRANVWRMFHTELGFFIYGMKIGTICFFLILVAWFVFWVGLMWGGCCYYQ